MPPLGSWTPERVEKLRVLWAEGLSAAEIAKQLGEPVLSRNSIISKANRTPGFQRRVAENFTGKDGSQKGFKTAIALAHERLRETRGVKKPNAKRVTLPPLPINGPVLTSDTKLLRSPVWNALEGTTPKTLTDLGAYECRWPIGENPTLFCGCATEKTYCDAHAKVAYRPFPEKVKK